MDCFSWSLPAGPATQDGCCVFATDFGICRDCFARNGRYNFTNVQTSQHTRLAWWNHWIQEDPAYLIDFMSSAIHKEVRNGFFRIFDSGDFNSPTAIEVWTSICASVPDVQFWCPTRSWRAKTEAWVLPLAELGALPNMALRPSALDFDEAPPAVAGLAAGTGVWVERVDGHICPKSINHTSCNQEGCRSCWTDKNDEVVYKFHGPLNRTRPTGGSEKVLQKRTQFKAGFAALTINKKEVSVV